MEIDLLIWILRYEVWLIAGFLFIALDMVLGLEFYALSLGVSALLLGILLLIVDAMGIALSWQLVLAIFAIDAMAVLIPLRKWLNRKKAEGGTDINDY